MSSSSCCFLKPAYRFHRRQVMWSGFPRSWRIFHNLLWSTQSKALAKSMKQKYMFFWNPLAFSMIQQMLIIWSLIAMPFLNPAWTSGSSWFMYCGSLVWRILANLNAIFRMYHNRNAIRSVLRVPKTVLPRPNFDECSFLYAKATLSLLFFSFYSPWYYLLDLLSIDEGTYR